MIRRNGKMIMFEERDAPQLHGVIREMMMDNGMSAEEVPDTMTLPFSMFSVVKVEWMQNKLCVFDGKELETISCDHSSVIMATLTAKLGVDAALMSEFLDQVFDSIHFLDTK